MRSLIVLSCIGVIAMLAGCQDPMAGVVSLHFETKYLHDGEFAITKGEGINIIGVYGEDADKNHITVSEGLTWSSSNPKLVDIHPLGSGALCIGTKDWFDTLKPEPVLDGGMPDAMVDDAASVPNDAVIADEDGGTLPDGSMPMGLIPFEPRSDVTVQYGNIKATVPVAVVLNLAGTWQVFLNGKLDKPEVEVTFVQNGRHLSDAITGATGDIHGNQLTLKQGIISLEGTLSSSTEAAGTSPLGPWQAIRRPTLTK